MSCSQSSPLHSLKSWNLLILKIATQSPADSIQSDVSIQSATPKTLSSFERAKNIDLLSRKSPLVALSDPDVADLFAHYIRALAPWYDLNDAQQTFGTLVPEYSLTCPLLFRAIIAFSASHKSRSQSDLQEIASAFHTTCIQDFLAVINETQPRSHGAELAATCLLRSFEIINGILLFTNHVRNLCADFA